MSDDWTPTMDLRAKRSQTWRGDEWILEQAWTNGTETHWRTIRKVDERGEPL